MFSVKMEDLNCFQVYSCDNKVKFLVDKIWIKNQRIYFRVLEKIQKCEEDFRKEVEPNVYSINSDSLYSIRCKLYF